MAIPEFEEYNKRQDIKTETTSCQDGPGNSRKDGQLDGQSPIPATDYFTGSLPEGTESFSLSGQHLLTTIGQRVTSIEGSESLDPISRATAMHKDGYLTIDPLREISVSSQSEQMNNVASVVSAHSAALKSKAQTTANDEGTNEMLSSVPSLTVDSLKNSGTMSSMMSQEPDQNEMGADTFPNNPLLSKNPAIPKTMNLETFAENCHFHDSQCESSGYKTGEVTVSQQCENTSSELGNSASGVNAAASGQNITHNSHSAIYQPLQLTEAGISALKCRSGTWSAPLHRRFCSFPSRLQSFHQVHVLLDGVLVNRDLLALAGFFNSGHNTVSCYHCGCNPRMWREGTDPTTEHRMISPYCKAIAAPAV